MLELIPILLFVALGAALVLGIPVAFALTGVGLAFAIGGIELGLIEPSHLRTLPIRIFGVLNNRTLIAVPLFIFMGLVLERSGIAEGLLRSLTKVAGPLPGGLGLVVILIGGLLAASTGIVGATVVMLSVLALPSLLKKGWHPGVASGLIAATGTLGQIIPPSIALILISEVISNAQQQAQFMLGNFVPTSISVGQVFMGALVPGLLLIGLYCCYMFIGSLVRPDLMPAGSPSDEEDEHITIPEFMGSLAPPLLMIVFVLGSIITGLATPTEASGVGAFGALLLAFFKGNLSLDVLRSASLQCIRITTMVFGILIGASIFSFSFREFGGDELIHSFFGALPGGASTAVLLLMVVIFVLGFFLDFIEITYIVLPLAAPAVLVLGVDPLWLAIIIAINLQTSFLTPPFGFALFYLRGAATNITTAQLYAGVLPFVALQIITIIAVAVWPRIVTWLPEYVYGA